MNEKQCILKATKKQKPGIQNYQVIVCSEKRKWEMTFRVFLELGESLQVEMQKRLHN